MIVFVISALKIHHRSTSNKSNKMFIPASFYFIHFSIYVVNIKKLIECVRIGKHLILGVSRFQFKSRINDSASIVFPPPSHTAKGKKHFNDDTASVRWLDQLTATRANSVNGIFLLNSGFFTFGEYYLNLQHTLV